MTATFVQSVQATELFTATGTETASIETILFTETTTVTADTQTITITETATVGVTETDVQTAATVTSTSWTYQSGASSLKARGTALSTAVPAYATDVCSSWDQYVLACKCAGVTAGTTTVAVETVTITVPATATSTVATVSLTSTETISVTATVSTTELATVALTESATTTSTATLTTTAIVSGTTTPVVVAPRTCKPVNLPFRASTVFAEDGSTRFMDVTIGYDTCAWQTFPGAVFGQTSSYKSMWRQDSEGYLELAYPLGTETTVRAPYLNLSTSTKASIAVLAKPKADVLAGVASGTFARLRACIDADTNVVYITAAGRSNILSCGNTFYLSTGDGTDYISSCLTLAPTAAFS